MQLLTKELKKKLIRNGETHRDHFPVVKFFDPCGTATWLISEMDATDFDTFFGLCDLGMGFPELGYVSLSELANVRNALGLNIERDFHFKADKALSQYAEEARVHQRIIIPNHRPARWGEAPCRVRLPPFFSVSMAMVLFNVQYKHPRARRWRSSDLRQICTDPPKADRIIQALAQEAQRRAQADRWAERAHHQLSGRWVDR